MDIITSFKLCKNANGSEYISNHPLIEEIVEKAEDEDEIILIATGNNESYPRNLSHRLNKMNTDYKCIKSIDPVFFEERHYPEKKIQIIPKTYQEELGLKGEGSESLDLIENIVKKKPRIIGLEICSHQIKDKELIKNILKENNYQLKEVYTNILIAEKKGVSCRKSSYESVKLDGDISDYKDWLETQRISGRLFEG